MEHTFEAFLLIEGEGKGHSISYEFYTEKKDAENAKADWESNWDVFKKIVPCKITYQVDE